MYIAGNSYDEEVVLNSEDLFFSKIDLMIYHRLRFPDDPSTPHWDNAIEILLILAGEGTITIGNTKFNALPGEIYIINCYERHGIETSSGLEYFFMSFKPEFIWENELSTGYLLADKEQLKKASFQNFINADSSWKPQIVELLNKTHEECISKNVGYGLMVKNYIVSLYLTMFRCAKADDSNDVRTIIEENSIEDIKNFERIKCGIVFVKQNYCRKLTLEDIAKRVFMNPNYFSTLFKKVMKMSLSDYIMDLRLKNAMFLLDTTKKRIIDISNESGFQCIANFNRYFRKMTGMSPGEYRKRKRTPQQP